MVEGQHGLSVATKLFRILGAFDAGHPHLRASEVCRRSGLPFSTVHRMLTELVTHGVLEHNSDGTYEVGIRMWEVAALNPQVASLRGIAAPWMYELCSTFRCDLHLDIRIGAEGLRLDELNGAGADSRSRLGARFPLRSTAGGHVLLAYAGGQALEALLAAPTTGPMEGTVAVAHGLRQGLAGIRRSGVAVIESRRHLSAASPLLGLDGGIVAALEMQLPAPGDPVRIAAAVQGAGIEISQALHRNQITQAHGATDDARTEAPHLISNLLPIQWVPPGQRARSSQDS